MRIVLTLGFVMLCALEAQAPAQAQIFISAAGNDASACTRTSPCRTLQRGVNATSPGRELTILTSGEYGRATIGKGMTVLAEGVSANIRSFVSGADAITINAPGGKVALKGLFLSGGNTGRYGIRITAAEAVHIERITAERFTGPGIFLDSAAGTDLFIADSISRYNSGGGLAACCNSSKLTVENSRFEHNGNDGVFVNTGWGSITRSIASGNGLYGIRLFDLGGSLNVTETTAANNQVGFMVTGVQLTLDSSVARGNTDFGLRVTASHSAQVTDSTFTNNGTGVLNEGTLYTRGNNALGGNTTDYQGNAPATLPGF
jgi:hypothetical protein